MIPGLQAPAADAHRSSPAQSAPSYTRNVPSAEATHVPGTAAQQAFISQIAPGAIAMQSRYGIPAAVTIAQAIDESGWGQSALAIRDHNLFGIKGTGPAGTDMLPTQEYQNGRYVTVNAPFRVYHNVAQSIADHGHLLATSSSYQHAMADRHLPDAFATDLTGVYATDPHYGSNLIAIMKLYNLYRYSAPDAQQAAPAPAVPAQVPAAPAAAAQVPAAPGGQQGGTANINGTDQGGTFGLGGVVNLNGQASEGGSDGQGSPATQHRSATQRGSATPGRIGRPGQAGRPGRAGQAVPAPPGTAGRRSPASLTATSPGRPAPRQPRRHRTPGPRILAARRRGSRRARPGPAAPGRAGTRRRSRRPSPPRSLPRPRRP